MHSSWAAAVILFIGSAAAKGIVYDCEKTPQICLNTCWAIKCQKNTKTLHGGGQKDKKASERYGDANRRKWGYGSKPCSKGGWSWTTPDKKKATSPDEYPYASSKEGGQANFQKVVALRCVPTGEQKAQGGKVRGIGTSKKSEKWTTKWLKIGKLSQDWCGPKPSCKNDGHQFVSGGSNGPFKLAANPKKVRDIGSYSEDGDSAWVESREVPDFVDLDGIEARDAEDEDSEIETRDVGDDETELEAGDAVEARDVEAHFES